MLLKQEVESQRHGIIMGDVLGKSVAYLEDEADCYRLRESKIL